MGMIADIFQPAGRNCSNNGISARHTKVCVVNVDGPFKPSVDAPAVKLMVTRHGNAVLVPVELLDSGAWTMFGGTFVYTSDSRFRQAVADIAGYEHGFAVALHDRVE